MTIYTLQVNGKVRLKTSDREKIEEAVAALSINKDQSIEILDGLGYVSTPEGLVQLSSDDGQWEEGTDEMLAEESK